MCIVQSKGTYICRFLSGTLVLTLYIYIYIYAIMIFPLTCYMISLTVWFNQLSQIECMCTVISPYRHDEHFKILLLLWCYASNYTHIDIFEVLIHFFLTLSTYATVGIIQNDKIYKVFDVNSHTIFGQL